MSKYIAEQIKQAKESYGVSRKKMLKEQKNNHYPRTAEPAMVHPLTNSAIKLRNNGMIDIFVGTDNGLRIDPKSKSINVIANWYKQHVDESRRDVRKRSLEVTGQHWTIYAGQNANIIAKGNINLLSKQDITMRAKNIRFEACGTISGLAKEYRFDSDPDPFVLYACGEDLDKSHREGSGKADVDKYLARITDHTICKYTMKSTDYRHAHQECIGHKHQAEW